LRLISIERVPDPNTTIAAVTFDDPGTIANDLQALYYSGEGAVSALAFFSQLRNLKREVYSAVSGVRTGGRA
jgi:hypothetical protein